MHNLHGFVAFMNKVALKLNRRKRFYIQSCSSVSAAYCHVIYLKNFFLMPQKLKEYNFAPCMRSTSASFASLVRRFWLLRLAISQSDKISLHCCRDLSWSCHSQQSALLFLTSWSFAWSSPFFSPFYSKLFEAVFENSKDMKTFTGNQRSLYIETWMFAL